MKTPTDQPENQPVAQPAVLRASISITRKATGLVEHYEIIGTPQIEPAPAEQPKQG